MVAISSLGIGSGLDINALVNSIVNAERAPKEARLDYREAKLQAQLSAYGLMKSSLSDFRGTLLQLSNINTFLGGTGKSSDDDIVTVVAESSAATGEYTLNVSQLAKAQSLASSGYSSMSDVVGAGTLEFRFGTIDYVADPESYNSFTQNTEIVATRTVTIDESNNTLEGMRDAINDADIGVKANIIFDGTDYRLTLSSEETGADYSMEVSVVDDADGNDTDTVGLSAFAFNANATNLEQTVAAQDAKLTLNGIAVTSSSNKVEDAISGVTLTLNKIQDAGDTDITITVGRDKNVIANAARNFVTAYNDVMSTVNDLTAYDAEKKESGILTGDSVARSVVTGLRRIINNEIVGLSGAFRSLADLGITTERDGKLKVDAVKLDAAIAQDPDAVAALFAKAGDSDTTAKFKYVSATSATEVGNYAVNIRQAAIRGLHVGSAVANLAIVTGINDTFDFTIDGVSGTLVLPATTYASAADFASDLQSRINGLASFSQKDVTVTVSESAGVLTIMSKQYGSESKVEITGGNGLFDLLGNSAVSSAGSDVVGTIGGASAEGSGRTLVGLGRIEGLTIEMQSDDTGFIGSVSYSEGLSQGVMSLIETFLSSRGSVSNRINGVENRIDDIADRRETLQRRIQAIEERVRAQFTAMDLMVAKMRSTGDYLTQQLANLPKIRVWRN